MPLEWPIGFSWLPGAEPVVSCQGRPLRALFTSQSPATQNAAITRAAGSMRANSASPGSCAPITEIASTRITSSPSSPRMSEAARVVSAASLPIAMSRTTRTTVWIAIPPRMFPIAIPRLCERAADAVIAISGRFVAIASRIAPPSASPIPSRTSSVSVERER